MSVLKLTATIATEQLTKDLRHILSAILKDRHGVLDFNIAVDHERITVDRPADPGSTSEFVRCICGNLPDHDGFFPCDATGRQCEPDENWKEGFYVCEGCNRIINALGYVVGTRPSRLNPLEHCCSCGSNGKCVLCRFDHSDHYVNGPAGARTNKCKDGTHTQACEDAYQQHADVVLGFRHHEEQAVMAAQDARRRS